MASLIQNIPVLAGPGSLCPAAQHLCRSPGETAQPWDLYLVWHKPRAAAGGTDLAQAGSWPSAEAVPVWMDFYFIWMDFLWIWGDAALLPEPALTGGQACKQQLSPVQGRHCTGSGNWINSDHTVILHQSHFLTATEPFLTQVKRVVGSFMQTLTNLFC